MKTTATNQRRYIIIATCNPYNARMHNHRCAVLERTGATATTWIVDDNLSDGYDIEEAYSILDEYAIRLIGRDYYAWHNEETIAEERKAQREMIEYDRDEAMSGEEIATLCNWYTRPGLYYDDELIYEHGDRSITDDVITFSILAIDEINDTFPENEYLTK